MRQRSLPSGSRPPPQVWAIGATELAASIVPGQKAFFGMLAVAMTAIVLLARRRKRGLLFGVA